MELTKILLYLFQQTTFANISLYYTSPSLSNESKNNPNPFQLSELPKTGPGRPAVSVNQTA